MSRFERLTNLFSSEKRAEKRRQKERELIERRRAAFYEIARALYNEARVVRLKNNISNRPHLFELEAMRLGNGELDSLDDLDKLILYELALLPLEDVSGEDDVAYKRKLEGFLNPPRGNWGEDPLPELPPDPESLLANTLVHA